MSSRYRLAAYFNDAAPAVPALPPVMLALYALGIALTGGRGLARLRTGRA